MPKRGRPFEYDTDEERPVTVSLRIPRDLYNRMEAHRRIHQQSVTELLLDGLRLRLDTPADPRDIILSDDNTVIQELQEMIRTAVEKEVGKLSNFMGSHSRQTVPIPPLEAPIDPVLDIPHDDNTVLQEVGVHKRGRRPVLRQPIMDCLQAHPEGLTAVQLKVHLNTDKAIGDTLSGMVRHGLLEKHGTGQAVRYTARPDSG